MTTHFRCTNCPVTIELDANLVVIPKCPQCGHKLEPVKPEPGKARPKTPHQSLRERKRKEGGD